MRKKECAKCGKPKEENRLRQAYCLSCCTEWNRLYRKKYSQLSEESKRKILARTFAYEYLERGKLIKQPCLICKSENNIEIHHTDYSKPLQVEWYCKKHHLEIHNKKMFQVKQKADRTTFKR